jgi:hypothetical protein
METYQTNKNDIVLKIRELKEEIKEIKEKEIKEKKPRKKRECKKKPPTLTITREPVSISFK